MIYNKIVQDCFFSPHHVGVLDTRKNTVVFVKNAQHHQAMIEFYMECTRDGAIRHTCYKTNGNPYLIAALEWSCRQLEGAFLDAIPRIDYQLLVKELAIPVSQYPLALRVVAILQEILVLMKGRLD